MWKALELKASSSVWKLCVWVKNLEFSGQGLTATVEHNWRKTGIKCGSTKGVRGSVQNVFFYSKCAWNTDFHSDCRWRRTMTHPWLKHLKVTVVLWLLLKRGKKFPGERFKELVLILVIVLIKIVFQIDLMMYVHAFVSWEVPGRLKPHGSCATEISVHPAVVPFQLGLRGIFTLLEHKKNTIKYFPSGLDYLALLQIGVVFISTQCLATALCTNISHMLHIQHVCLMDTLAAVCTW